MTDRFSIDVFGYQKKYTQNMHDTDLISCHIIKMLVVK